ncbi:hypothetical protein E3N88_45595 [Mikania micrantha]|uniref:Uncharacterized protein n=1 Tax=Mikania micrantha TaxID=192012 RepID=A0A5N6L8P7_9ASTR|nr:hypothetical protein E3N88_45595 [Mikania micrantha]
MGSIHSRGLLFQCQQKVYPAVLLLYFFLDCWEHGAAYIGWLMGGWPRQSAMAHSHATDLVLGCLWLWHRDDRDMCYNGLKIVWAIIVRTVETNGLANNTCIHANYCNCHIESWLVRFFGYNGLWTNMVLVYKGQPGDIVKAHFSHRLWLNSGCYWWKGVNSEFDMLMSLHYLTETPAACNDKVVELLGFIVSVQGEDEQSPFYSVCFLLPMLCQITMEADGCQLIVSSETYKATKQIRGHLDDAYFIRLMGVMSSWAVINSTSEIMLRHNPHFNHDNLISLCQLTRRSLATDGKVT